MEFRQNIIATSAVSVFNRELDNQPVIILKNKNDCAIAHSQKLNI